MAHEIKSLARMSHHVVGRMSDERLTPKPPGRGCSFKGQQLD